MTEEVENAGGGKTASLMISYSRKDKVFVKQLYDSLVAQGFSPDHIWVDWEGIPLSADWMAEITKGIQSANAFIFVISPDSVASEVCQKEIEIAVASNKRFIPILHREPGKGANLHEKISSHNWVYMRDEDEMVKMLPSFIEAINTDLDWLAQHTRLFNRAKEWEDRGRNDSYLVRGSDLQDAENFISEGAAGKDPSPTPLHVEYVKAAQKFAAARRRRNRIITVVVGVALFALAVFASIQAVRATNNEKQAVANLNIAYTEQVRADNNAATAQANEAIAQKNSRKASALADPQLSLMLALLSIQETAQDNIVQPESKSALFTSLNTPNVIHTWDNDGVIVWSVAYDPNGEYIAIGDKAGVLNIYDIKNRELMYSKQFDDTVSGLDFSPDGTRLGVVSWDGTAKVFGVESGDELFSLAGHDGYSIYDIDFSPDGNLIATGGGDWYVKIWNANNGSIRVTLPSHTDSVNSVAFSTDSTRLVSGSDDDTVILWDLENNSLLNKFRPDGFDTAGGYVNSVAFNPWDDRIIAGGYQTVVIWDADDYSEIHRLRGNQADVYSVAFAPDGLSMLTASSGVKIWDWYYGTERFNLSSHRGEVTSAAYSSDGQYILTGSWDTTTKLWSANLKLETLRLTQHIDQNTDANYSSDGKWIITADSSGYVFVHDAQTGDVVYDYDVADDEQINAVSFNPQNSEQFVTGDDIGQLQVWQLGQTDPVWSVSAYDGWVESAIFSPDGSMILTAGGKEAVRLWDAQSGDLVRELNDPDENYVYKARFSPDGKRIITATRGNIAQIWDAQTGEWILDLVGHTDYVLTAIFSQDGKYAYTAGYDNTIRKWDSETGEELLIMTGHTGRVRDLDISPDDSLLASGSADTTVRVWDVETGKEIFNYQGNNEYSRSVAFSPDGKRVLTASYDNTTKEFTIDYDRLLEVAQEYELRPLTQEECKRYLDRDDCTLTLFGGTASTNDVSSSPAVQTQTPTPSAAQPPQATSSPTVAPTATTAAAGSSEAFYTEEFNGNLDSWDSFMVTGIESQVNAGIDNGSLFIQLSPFEDKVPRYYLVNPGFDYSSVQLELVITNNGNNANGVSLVCQYSENGWYEFRVSNAGLYSIDAYDQSVGYSELLAGGAPVIKSGRSTNTYTAVCNGSDLSLAINGEPVNSIVDTKYNFTDGRIGFGVSSPDLLPVDVSMDTLIVSEP